MIQDKERVIDLVLFDKERTVLVKAKSKLELLKNKLFYKGRIYVFNMHFSTWDVETNNLVAVFLEAEEQDIKGFDAVILP